MASCQKILLLLWDELQEDVLWKASETTRVLNWIYTPTFSSRGILSGCWATVAWRWVIVCCCCRMVAWCFCIITSIFSSLTFISLTVSCRKPELNNRSIQNPTHVSHGKYKAHFNAEIKPPPAFQVFSEHQPETRLPQEHVPLRLMQPQQRGREPPCEPRAPCFSYSSWRRSGVTRSPAPRVVWEPFSPDTLTRVHRWESLPPSTICAALFESNSYSLGSEGNFPTTSPTTQSVPIQSSTPRNLTNGWTLGLS